MRSALKDTDCEIVDLRKKIIKERSSLKIGKGELKRLNEQRRELHQRQEEFASGEDTSMSPSSFAHMSEHNVRFGSTKISGASFGREDDEDDDDDMDNTVIEVQEGQD